MIQFIKNIFSADKSESAKRFFGAIGFICAIVFIAIWAHNLIDELLYISAALIGLGILDRWIKK